MGFESVILLQNVGIYSQQFLIDYTSSIFVTICKTICHTFNFVETGEGLDFYKFSCCLCHFLVEILRVILGYAINVLLSNNISQRMVATNKLSSSSKFYQFQMFDNVDFYKKIFLENVQQINIANCVIKSKFSWINEHQFS